MGTLDADQLTDFRADVGDDGTVFTDAELHRLYTRAGDDYSAAVVLALRQILMNAAKLHDYSLVNASESKSQVFKNLKDMLTYWESRVQGGQQVQFAAMHVVPPRTKDTPDA